MMTFCRMGWDSDVHLEYGGRGGYQCWWCKLTEEQTGWEFFSTEEELHKHLNEHKTAGHKVPDYAYGQDKDGD